MMMAIQNFTLPKPRDDDHWELWCKKIFSHVYKVDDFQRFETRGKSQKGIDLLATLDDGRVIVVQCKRRGTKKALTQTEIERDYKAAMELECKPDEFVVATTHDKKGLQEWAAGKNSPKARVYAWPDIEDLFAHEPGLRKALYGAEDLDAIREMIEREIKPIAADAKAGRRDAALIRSVVVDQPRDAAAEFADEYAGRVAEALDELELFGVDLPPEAKQYKLSVAYISLNMESGSGEVESGPRAAQAVLAGAKSKRLIIRGEAGSGKTTLLKWAAIQCRGAAWRREHNIVSVHPGPTLLKQMTNDANTSRWGAFLGPHGTRIGRAGRSEASGVEVRFNFDAPVESLPWCLRFPFLIRLRDCADGKLPPLEKLASVTCGMHGATPPGWVQNILQDGYGLVLLDGIDEVPPRHRATLHKQVKQLIKELPDNFYVLTTRPLSEGEPEWLDEMEFVQARVSPMSRVDREACIDRWHHAVGEGLSSRGRPDGKLSEYSDRLKAALNDAPEIARLATNPLLCAMICALHRSKNHLPDNLNELLESLCMVLLYSREKETRDPPFPEAEPRYAALSYEDRKAIVSHLAKYMVMEGESALPRKMVKRKVGEALDLLKSHSNADAEVVVKGLIERSGMLREKSASTIDFIHNTFKEYLAAVRFLGRSEVKILADNAHEAGWDNVAVFAAASAVQDPEFSNNLMAKLLPHVSAAKPTRRKKSVTKPDEIPAADVVGYKRAVTAVRVASAMRTKLEPEVEKRYKAMRKELFPPRTWEAAAGLATAGNSVLKFVSFTKSLTQAQQVRCIRTLRLIGTPEAKDRLLGFRDTRNLAVIGELAQAIDPFEMPAVVESFCETVETMAARQSRSYEDDSWRGAVRDTAAKHVASCAALAKRGDLAEISLGGTRIDDRAIAQLFGSGGSFASLTLLDLTGTAVSNDTATWLSRPETGLKALASLDLAGTKVSDAGVEALSRPETGLKGLTLLDLRFTQVTDAAVAAFQKLRPNVEVRW